MKIIHSRAVVPKDAQTVIVPCAAKLLAQPEPAFLQHIPAGKILLLRHREAIAGGKHRHRRAFPVEFHGQRMLHKGAECTQRKILGPSFDLIKQRIGL